jgi:hypothetical protein
MKWWDVLINLGKDLFRACRAAVWFLLPMSALMGLGKWLLQDYFPARAKDLLGWLIPQIPAVNISPSSVSIAWDRINQWVPMSEIVNYSVALITLAGSIAILKAVKKLLPGS